MRRLGLYFSLFVLILLNFSGLSAPSKKPKIIKRHVTNTKAYDKITSSAHIAIKVKPPKVYGPGQYIFVEIYNNTKESLSLVGFNLALGTGTWSNFEFRVEAEDILPGRSAVRKIRTPQGKGTFPNFTAADVANLKIYNTDASQVLVNVYVDLVRVNVKKSKRK